MKVTKKHIHAISNSIQELFISDFAEPSVSFPIELLGAAFKFAFTQMCVHRQYGFYYALHDNDNKVRMWRVSQKDFFKVYVQRMALELPGVFEYLVESL